MRRIIDVFLDAWKHEAQRRPLLLRGARQVGKTYAVRTLGKNFNSFLEVNFELQPQVHKIFEKDLQPERIVRELALFFGKPIVSGETLLFFDEIQSCPNAIIALRYFYELMPELHVIAAGSLLDFIIEQIGIPVGRVQSLYVYPLSFIEFLAALGQSLLIEEILSHSIEKPMPEVVHQKLLIYVGQYLALGGMPQAVLCWQELQDALKCMRINQILLDTYRQDFGKYAKKNQIKYVTLLFDQIPLQLGKKFKYSDVEGEYRKRELGPALDLLVTAGVAHKVFHSSGFGIPLGAQADLADYKVIFLDVGLSQAVLGFDISGWILDPIAEFVNKGPLVEAFIGQELLAYSDPTMRKNLYYWRRESRASQAEVDYLVQKGSLIVPLEVKAGSGKTLKSLQLFLESHKSLYGLRFSQLNYSVYEKIHSYPLYAVAAVVSAEQPMMQQAMKYIVEL